jgi:hypothetical protein
MLPVFAIVFFGVMYIKDATITAQTNLSKVRRCAWQYSNEACESDLSKIDPICQNSMLNSNTPDTLFRTDQPVSRGDEVPTDPALRTKVDDYNKKATTKNEKDSGLMGELKEAVLSTLSFVGELFENKKTNVSASKTIATGKILGNRKVTVGVGYRISCNVKPKTLKDLFLEFLDAVNPF